MLFLLLWSYFAIIFSSCWGEPRCFFSYNRISAMNQLKKVEDSNLPMSLPWITSPPFLNLMKLYILLLISRLRMQPTNPDSVSKKWSVLRKCPMPPKTTGCAKVMREKRPWKHYLITLKKHSSLEKESSLDVTWSWHFLGTIFLRSRETVIRNRSNQVGKFPNPLPVIDFNVIYGHYYIILFLIQFSETKMFKIETLGSS